MQERQAKRQRKNKLEEKLLNHRNWLHPGWDLTEWPSATCFVLVTFCTHCCRKKGLLAPPLTLVSSSGDTSVCCHSERWRGMVSDICVILKNNHNVPKLSWVVSVMLVWVKLQVMIIVSKSLILEYKGWQEDKASFLEKDVFISLNSAST